MGDALGLYLGLILIVTVSVAIGVMYNTLVRKRNYCYNAFAQIDVQLARRHDLIPNLVSTAKEYLRHESEVLTRVIEARNRAQNSLENSRKNVGNTEMMAVLSGSELFLNQSLSAFFMTVEEYPELKANEHMALLSQELVHTENRVSYARQSYNDTVLFYNNQRESFPNNIVARVFHFLPMAELELNFEANAPAIKL